MHFESYPQCDDSDARPQVTSIASSFDAKAASLRQAATHFVDHTATLATILFVARRDGHARGSTAGRKTDQRPRTKARPPVNAEQALSRRRAKRLQPEDYLDRAMRAATPRTRGNWARRGLATDGDINNDTQAMLLRQLYLSHYTQRQFQLAYAVALQATELAVLPDVIHQDCARAKQALGDIDGAAAHLRLAARLGPASRRAFHHWTLGSMLHLSERGDEAISALKRAVRWGSTDKPLYRGQLALAKLAMGTHVRGGKRLMAELQGCPAGQGYGRFVLGQLAFHLGMRNEARQHLDAFIERTRKGRPAMRVALEPEVLAAETTLSVLDEATL